MAPPCLSPASAYWVLSQFGSQSDNARERAHHLSKTRAWAAILVVEAQAATLTELGRRFNRDVATLSNGARQLRKRISKNADLAGRLAQMQPELMQKTNA